MFKEKADIIAQLQKDILPLQGCKPVTCKKGFSNVLGLIRGAFPQASFPLGAMHEFFCEAEEDVSASTGFIAGIISALMETENVAVWINPGLVFPPALKIFGIEPDKIIFIHISKEKEILWAMEEALKCKGLAAVIAETPELSFTTSRRLQLAVEQSSVTGFIIRKNPRNLVTACVTRWKITSLPSVAEFGMPGVGAPRWNVELLKVRNGTPGVWQLEWTGRFRHVLKIASLNLKQEKKAV